MQPQNNYNKMDMNNSQEHEYVDLGLPSGTLWATCNVGASKPEDYGDYFSWDVGNTAVAKWGKGWRMPSKEQWEELRRFTESTWTTRNGVKGRHFTSRKNGKSLFLPAAGSSTYTPASSDGSYWSSSLYTGSPYDAWYFGFGWGTAGVGISGHYWCRSVRAVREN